MDIGKSFPGHKADHSPPSGTEVKKKMLQAVPCIISMSTTALSNRKPAAAGTSATTAVLRDTMKETRVWLTVKYVRFNTENDFIPEEEKSFGRPRQAWDDVKKCTVLIRAGFNCSRGRFS